MANWGFLELLGANGAGDAIALRAALDSLFKTNTDVSVVAIPQIPQIPPIPQIPRVSGMPEILQRYMYFFFISEMSGLVDHFSPPRSHPSEIGFGKFGTSASPFLTAGDSGRSLNDSLN